MEAQAALDQAEINLGYTEIRSPIDGRDRAGHRHRRQSGSTLFRQACDHRQPGPDLCHLPGQPAQSSRLLQAPRRRAGKNTHVNIRIKLPDGTNLSACRREQLPRRAGRPEHRHRDGARDSAKPGACADPGRSCRRDRGAGRAEIGADRFRRPRSSSTSPATTCWSSTANKVEQRRVQTGAEQGTDVVVTTASRRARTSSSRASRKSGPARSSAAIGHRRRS